MALLTSNKFIVHQRLNTFFRFCVSLCLIILLVSMQNVGFAQQTNDSSEQSKKSIAKQVNNPAAPLSQFQLRNIFSSKIPGYEGSGNLLQLVPILPIPKNDFFKFSQLIKITFQVPSAPSPDKVTGLGDIELFDLITFQKSWGVLAPGFTFVFPTATSEILGQGKWQIGPAFAIMYTKNKHAIIGAVFQNQVSFAGDPSRENVNTLIITPTVTWTFKNDWFAGYSDFDWTIDWRNDGAVTIPVGIQAGKVVKLSSLPISISMEGCYMPVRPDTIPKWLFGYECVLVVPSIFK